VGLTGAAAALIAAYHRQQTGRGDVIDVALYEPLFRLLIPHVTQFLTLGIRATRAGNHFPDAAPRNLYQTRDGGWVAISATSQRTFERLAAAIGQPELVKSPEFRDNGARVQNREKLDAIVASWMALRTQSDALGDLEEAGVVAGSVYDFPEIVQDPQYAARDDIIVVPDADTGEIPMVGVIPKLQDAPGSVSNTGPSLGAHNREIYGGWLAIDDAEIAELRAEEVL
jgi:crotonobetainyl-CoA:carnitine CoA-transferase CaiB-like acyl-CoA transferase